MSFLWQIVSNDIPSCENHESIPYGLVVMDWTQISAIGTCRQIINGESGSCQPCLWRVVSIWYIGAISWNYLIWFSCGPAMNFSRGKNSERRKRESLACDILSWYDMPICDVSWMDPIWFRSYGPDMIFSQSHITHEWRKRELLSLLVSHCLDMIHISVKFKESIP